MSRLLIKRQRISIMYHGHCVLWSIGYLARSSEVQRACSQCLRETVASLRQLTVSTRVELRSSGTEAGRALPRNERRMLVRIYFSGITLGVEKQRSINRR
jgi:hypothetical protein